MNPFKFTFIFVSALSALGLLGKMAKPNILWMTSEDNSIEWISCYGSKTQRLLISTNLQKMASATSTALITERSVPRPDPPGLRVCTPSPTEPSRCAAVSRFLHLSASTTSSCKRPVTSPAIVRKPTTTSEHPVVEIRRTSGTTPERTMQELGSFGKKANPFSPYTTSGRAMNPGPSGIIRTNPLTPRK